MRKLMGLCLLFVMIASVAGFAADKKLSDHQMDAITAGLAGGVFVGGSTGDITENYYVTVDRGAGNGAATLNFINAAGGQVAIGTNILAAPLMIITPDTIRQINRLEQEDFGGAVLEGYATMVGGFNATLLHVDHAELTALDVDATLLPPEFNLAYLNGQIDDLTYLDVAGFFAFHGIEFASGGFVVADGSDLTYSSTSATVVDRGALSDVRAVNIVNAANTQVGIGLNLAVMNQMFGTDSFRQINVITQTKSACGCGL